MLNAKSPTTGISVAILVSIKYSKSTAKSQILDQIASLIGTFKITNNSLLFIKPTSFRLGFFAPLPPILTMINRTRFRSSGAISTQPTSNGHSTKSAALLSTNEICDDRLDMRNCSGRLTQEWLDEAKRIVASSSATSASACDSSAKITGAPRFGSVRISTGALICRKDPLSRSARRNRATEGFSEEILSRSARHARTGSILSNTVPDFSTSPTSQVNMWIANNIEPPNGLFSDDDNSPGKQSTLPQRRSSRFQPEPKQDVPQRRFKQDPNTETRVLSPPKNLVESAHRRTISRSTCLMEKIAAVEEEGLGVGGELQGRGVNGFLKKQRARFGNMMMTKKA